MSSNGFNQFLFPLMLLLRKKSMKQAHCIITFIVGTDKIVENIFKLLPSFRILLLLHYYLYGRSGGE